MEDVLWLWFFQERRCTQSFSCSTNSHGVHYIGVSDEKLSANLKAAKDFSARFLKLVNDENLSPEQIYDIDKTGLNFKLLPTKTFATMQEISAPGFKISKEWIAVALSSNASGTHKLPLFVIGKAAKLRAFKNINI